MSDTLRFRWQIADGTLRMNWTAEGVEPGLDARDVLKQPALQRGRSRA